MSTTVRVHRGYASPDRIVMVGGHEVGRLEREVNDYEITPGSHVLTVRLGYSEECIRFHAEPEETVEVFVRVTGTDPQAHHREVTLDLTPRAPRFAHEGEWHQLQ